MDPNGDKEISHELSYKIGNFPKESAKYKVHYTAVKSPELCFAKGRAGNLRISSKINQPAEVEHQVSIPLSELHITGRKDKLMGSPLLYIFLNGFRIQSVNNHSGWHFGGLGIKLDQVRIENEFIHFTVDLFCKPSRSPEPIHHGNKKWTYKDDCIYSVEADFIVVGGDEGSLHVTDSQISYHSPVAGVEFNNRFVTELKGKPRFFENSFSAVKGFHFEISHQPKPILKNRTGRYIREIGFFCKNLGYDALTGRASVESGMIFSNKATLLRSLASKFLVKTSMQVALVQIDEQSEVRQHTLQGLAGVKTLSKKDKVAV